jgi:hypothetical protein
MANDQPLPRSLTFIVFPPFVPLVNGRRMLPGLHHQTCLNNGHLATANEGQPRSID